MARTVPSVVIALAMLMLAGSAAAQESSDPRVRLREGVKRESLDADGQ